MCAKSLQWYLTVCDSMDYSPPDSVHGILQARILEWVATLSSRGSPWPRDQACISCGSSIAGRFLITEPQGKPKIYLQIKLVLHKFTFYGKILKAPDTKTLFKISNECSLTSNRISLLCKTEIQLLKK